jgi:hypothetical protein
MLKKFTFLAALIVIVTTLTSAAFARSRHSHLSDRHNNVRVYGNVRVPISGAEWWQNKGIIEEIGYHYRTSRHRR